MDLIGLSEGVRYGVFLHRKIQQKDHDQEMMNQVQVQEVSSQPYVEIQMVMAILHRYDVEKNMHYR